MYVPLRCFRVAVYVSVLIVCTVAFASAQSVNVTTYHYDNSRTGQNLQESILNLGNVNSSQFGKLYSTPVDGYVYAQPLYVANVQNIANGTHNVLYVATEHDSLYAMDADSGTILWRVSFIDPSANITTVPSSDVSCGDLVPEIGITSTPVINLATKTLYVVVRTKESGSYYQRLHAIDIVTGAEKFGGPVSIVATVSGSGAGSNHRTVAFDPLWQANRPGLLLENDHVVIGWGSECDNQPYHGWVMSYSASTLAQEAVWNSSPNGSAAGVWLGGDGLAADSGGNIYFATGNGTYDGTGKGDFGDSILRLSGPSGGQFTVADWFTPSNQSSLSAGDTDVASGGVLLLPDLPAGSVHTHLLVQMGKEGRIYLIDRDNMGKYCSGCSSDTQIVQEISGESAGIWGTPAYWNGFVYWGGGADEGNADYLKAFSFNAADSGMLSTLPTSMSSKLFSYSTPAPVISANGNSNGILWILDNSSYDSSCCQVLYAYDATNLANMLYNSSQAPNNRDRSGGAVKFTAPVVANGKVYAGSQTSVTAWGLLNSSPTAAPPTFAPAPGSYSSPQSVALSDATPGATIYYTTDNSTPSTLSPLYTAPITVASTTTVKAMAAATGYINSPVATGIYTIAGGNNFGSGFSCGGLTLNGSAVLSGTRLRLTDGGYFQAGSGFCSAPVDITNFTTDFSFQMSNAQADGMTFTIQNVDPMALGPSGGGLGYGPDTTGGTPGILASVAVKFDIYDNSGEGSDSTGLYLNGVSPTVPALDMTSSGVNLLSGDVFNVHMTYDGATLMMTITDASNAAKTFSASWPLNITSAVGSDSAYVGFTGGTGGFTATQDVITWSYESSSQTVATPTVSTWPTASPIVYGQTLASSTLTGGVASVPGTFAFTTPNLAPDAGIAAQSVTFTPTDTTNYSTVTGTVNVTVNNAKLTPTVSTWPAASAIIYGQTLASSILSGGSASVPGTFAFTTPSTAPGAGTSAQSVTFTPTDTADYNTVLGAVNVTVSKAITSVTSIASNSQRVGNSSNYNISVSFTISPQLSGTPSGMVNVSVGGESCSVTLTGTQNGSGSCVLSKKLSAGSYTASVSYAGDTNFLASIGSANITVP
jgi:hypothetical protein